MSWGIRKFSWRTQNWSKPKHCTFSVDAMSRTTKNWWLVTIDNTMLQKFQANLLKKDWKTYKKKYNPVKTYIQNIQHLVAWLASQSKSKPRPQRTLKWNLKAWNLRWINRFLLRWSDKSFLPRCIGHCRKRVNPSRRLNGNPENTVTALGWWQRWHKNSLNIEWSVWGVKMPISHITKNTFQRKYYAMFGPELVR